MALASGWLALLASLKWRTRATGGKPNLGRYQVRLFLLCVSLHRPHKAASPGRLVVPSEDYSHGRARIPRPEFVKGDGQKTQ